MKVTILGAKICYGADDLELATYINNAKAKIQLNLPLIPNNITAVEMTDEQFVRFKNAGRQHASKKPKKVGLLDRTRPDRTADDELQKWDVARYGDLTGRDGPWGGGASTNRDHMTANSSNQMRAHTHGSNQVKNDGLAITVSGDHHRVASWTYGGRTKTQVEGTGGLNRMEYGAQHPSESFGKETDEMLGWKAYHDGKTTIRVEMVGAYCYMYMLSVKQAVIKPTIETETLLLQWLQVAVFSDDGVPRF